MIANTAMFADNSRPQHQSQKSLGQLLRNEDMVIDGSNTASNIFRIIQSVSSVVDRPRTSITSSQLMGQMILCSGNQAIISQHATHVTRERPQSKMADGVSP
jgi:hypothetical protein